MKHMEQNQNIRNYSKYITNQNIDKKKLLNQNNYCSILLKKQAEKKTIKKGEQIGWDLPAAPVYKV